MAKVSGLNVRLYVEGNDLSGDANSLDGLGYTQEAFDTTTLSQAAVSRLSGRADGTVGVSAFFDAATSHISAVATANSGKLPTSDQTVMVPMGSAVGAESISFVARQADYGVSGGTGSPVTVSVSYAIDAVAPTFGKMTTSHLDTITSSTSGTAIDDSASSSDGGSWGYQVTALSAVGGNARWHLNLQHSSDDSSYTDVASATVTASDGTGAANADFTGTLNRYVKYRVVLDASSGSITFAIAYTRT